MRCLTSLFIVLLFSTSLYAATTIAKVGSVEITDAELSREFQKILPMKGTYHGGVSEEKIQETRTEALDTLIERAYKVQYALNNNLQVGDKRIQEVIERAKSRYSSEEEFIKALGSETLMEFTRSLKYHFLAEKAEELIYSELKEPTEEELKGYYDQHKDMYQKPKAFTASHILIKVDPSSPLDVQEEKKIFAENLAERAKAGEDFYNLAYYNSDDKSKFVGGSLGTFSEGRAVQVFDDALNQMEPGEISGPFRSIYGYHIVYLQDVHEARLQTFDEVSEKLKTLVIEQKKRSIYKDWFSDMKEKYPSEKM